MSEQLNDPIMLHLISGLKEAISYKTELEALLLFSDQIRRATEN